MIKFIFVFLLLFSSLYEAMPGYWVRNPYALIRLTAICPTDPPARVLQKSLDFIRRYSQLSPFILELDTRFCFSFLPNSAQ